MRADIFLHRSALIRRRTRARQACEAGRVRLSGRLAKPASSVEPGMVLSLASGGGEQHWKVLALPSSPAPKSDQARYVEPISAPSREGQ